MTLSLIKLSVGLLLSIVIFQQSVVLPTSAVEYYVTPMLPNPECPPDKPCFELDQYALKSSQYFSNEENVTMYFLDGDHTLMEELNFSGVRKLSWLGNSSETSRVHFHRDTLHSVPVTNINVAELLMSKLTVEGVPDYYTLSWTIPTISCHLEEMTIMSMYVIIKSEGIVFIADSTFITTYLELQIVGSSGDRETVIKNSRLIDSLDSFMIYYRDEYYCDACQIQLILDNVTVTTDHTPDSVIASQIDVVIFSPHKVNITHSSFNGSTGIGVLFNFSPANYPGPMNSTYNGEIAISDSQFSENHGGGLNVVLENVGFCAVSDIPLKFSIKNCNFTKNFFTSLIVTFHDLNDVCKDSDTSIRPLFSIENCTFSYNSRSDTQSESGLPSALLVVGGVQEDTAINVVISHSMFKGNVDTQNVPTTVLSVSTNVNVTNCTFLANMGTGIKLYNSDVLISGDVYFVSNSAYEGGGIVLAGNSYLHLNDKTSVTFYNNTAQHVGGGILVQHVVPLPLFDDIDTSSQSCFYQVDEDFQNITVNMIDNSATDGGDHIYGASLKSECLATNSLSSNRSYEISDKIFHFSGDSNHSRVSSDQTRVCLCDQGVPNCTDIDKIFDSVDRFPGETFTISAALVGDDFGLTSGTIYTRFNSPNSSILELQTSQTVNASCNEIEVTVYSNKTGIQETLTLGSIFSIQPVNISARRKYVQYQVSTYMQYGYISNGLLRTPIYIQVHFLECPLGFVLSNSQCQCDPVLANNNIECAIENQTGYIYRNRSIWINASYDDNETSNGIILNKFCPHQYCKEERLGIELEVPNRQCAFNRSGTLCGACKEGHSVALGSQTCLDCENNRGVALLVFFILAGPLLVLFIKFLDLTVTHGTINGLIFYANIVWVNQSYLFPENKSLPLQILRVFIAWINLDFGIETCFFVGLDAYWKTWMQFLFPFYIWTIAGLIIILCRYSVVLTKLFGRNSVHVLATLILLSYAKLLRTIISIFEFSSLKFPDGHQLIVWALDGNVSYVVSKHGALFCAGIAALLFLWLPYTMTLFLVPWLRAKSNWKCLHWINKLQPFFDANFGPLKDRHHYWIGVLLLVRGFLFLLQATISQDSQIINFIIIAIFVAVLLGHPEPYKKWYLSLLEKSFLINVIVFCIGVFYAESAGGNTALIITSLGFAAFQFVVIVLAHAYVTIRRLNMCKKHCPVNNAHTHNMEHTERPRPRLNVGLSHPGENRYNQLRESMLESDEYGAIN